MKTETLGEFQALQLASLLDKVKRGLQFTDAHDYYGFKAKDNALIVEPVNGNPYVFVMPNTLHTFESIPGSGTDALRQRILAEQFFDNLGE